MTRRLLPSTLLWLGLALLLGSVSVGDLVSCAGAYDMVFRIGRVIDGAGNPWIRADLAIRYGWVV